VSYISREKYPSEKQPSGSGK